jgi:hypothetical protein
MRTFLIQCKLPETSSDSFFDLIAIIQKVNAELNVPDNKSSVTWLQSFLTNNRLYCIYSSQHSMAFVKQNVPITNLITQIDEISGSIVAENDHKKAVRHLRSQKLLEKNFFKF